MRIISGECKGRIISPPRNFKARPTTDFAKENLFNVLANRYDFDGLQVLDLFSGTGSISFEFASRGAARVVSVEMDSVHQSFIRETAKKLNLLAVQSIRANAFTFLKSAKGSYDIVFADPPYELDGIDAIIDTIFKNNLIAEGGCFIFEHSKSKNFSEHPRFLELRSYGSVNFSFFGLN